jgi:hypothetical protein
LWLSSGHNNCPLCRAGWINEGEENVENVEVILLPTPIKLEDLTTLEPLEPPPPKKTRGRKKKTEMIQPSSIIIEPVVIKKTRCCKKKTETETIE